MDSQPATGRDATLTHMITDMANAVSERNGETRQRQLSRAQAAVAMILSFRPRDVIEAMLAGHCVMFHEVIVDSVRDTLRGEMDTSRRATRSGIVAMNKSFTGNLGLLERYQTRPCEAGSVAATGLVGMTPPVVAPAAGAVAVEPAVQAPASVAVRPVQASAPAVRPAVSAEGAARASGATASVLAAHPSALVAEEATHPPAVAETSKTGAALLADRKPASTSANVATPAAGVATQSLGNRPDASETRRATAATGTRMADPLPAGAVGSGGPSAGVLAAFHANPEAAAALKAGDAAGFARAMGIEPSAEFLAAAAAPGSPFDRRAAGPWVSEPVVGRKG